jgi:hypothetical protein
MFSLTSSTVDKGVRAVAPEIWTSHEKRRSFELVLVYAELSHLLSESDEDAAAALAQVRAAVLPSSGYDGEYDVELLEKAPPPTASSGSKSNGSSCETYRLL